MFSLKFLHGLLSSNSRSCLNAGFVQRTITRMASQIAAAYQFAFVDTLRYSLITRLLPNVYMDYFHQSLAQVRTCALSDNQDGHHNGRPLSGCTCGHTNFVIYHLISSKFHIYGLLLLSSNYCSYLNMGSVQ